MATLQGIHESAKVYSNKSIEGVSVSTKPPAPPPGPVPAQDRYMPGDPIPVPEAVEANSESSWAMFSDNPPPPEGEFLDTVPASLLEEAALATPPNKN